MKRTAAVIAGALGLVTLLSVPLPARQKRVYIADDNHTDYMWTTDEAGFRSAFLAMLDYYLDRAEATRSEAPAHRSRFNTDGTLWIREYEKNRPAAAFNRLIDHIKAGSIGVPLTLLHLDYGAMPAEAVLRSMYYAGQLERRHGLDLTLALAQENQTLPFGLGTLFSGAGASYMWKGICGCASRVPDAWDRFNEMYWWTGLDGSRILTKWYSMLRHDYYDIGGYAEARSPSAAIDFVTSDAGFQARHPYDVIGVFGYGGDDLETFTETFVQTAKAKTTADRQVIVSNTVDFFEDFSRTYGGRIPSQSLSFGNEWDLLPASLSEVTASVKRATEKLRTAEAMAAIATLGDAAFMRGREEAGGDAWVDLGLYYEHDWTADGPISRDQRAAWERARAAGVVSYVETLYEDARNALGGMIFRSGSGDEFFVFNPLGWERTGQVDLPYSGTGTVRVLDSTTGLEVPSQTVTVEGRTVLRLWASGIPPIGYKTYEIVSAAGGAFGGGPTAEGNVLENAFVRLAAGSNGAILSLIDKRRGDREMVKASGGRAVNDFGPGGGTIAVENAGPVSATLRIDSPGPPARTTRMTLYRDSPQIDIRNEIRQNFGDIRTWDFNLNLDAPLLRHEEIGAVLTARLAGDGGHYAPRAARYDWLTINHFADLSAGGSGLTISSPDLSFMRRGESSSSYLDTRTPQLSLLAGGQVDGPALGIPGQGGDAFFLQRFGLQPHGEFDAVEAMRFALEHQNPLVFGRVAGGTKLPARSLSILSGSHPGVFLWAVKPAEDSAAGGIVVRLWNQTAEDAVLDLYSPAFDILAARRTSLIETPLDEPVDFQSDRLTATIPKFGWRAFHLQLDGDPITGKGIGRKKIR